jgi:hypothetical protein
VSSPKQNRRLLVLVLLLLLNKMLLLLTQVNGAFKAAGLPASFQKVLQAPLNLSLFLDDRPSTPKRSSHNS